MTLSKTLLGHIGKKLIRGSTNVPQRNLLTCEIWQGQQERECLHLSAGQKRRICHISRRICRISRGLSQTRWFCQTTGDGEKEANKGASQKPDVDKLQDKGTNENDVQKKTGVDVPEKKQITPKDEERPEKVLVFVRNTEIDHDRAMKEFLLDAKDLEKLPKRKSRSSYSSRKDMTVYRLVDLERRANEKWGSMKNLENEKRLRQEMYERRVFTGIERIWQHKGLKGFATDKTTQREESQFKLFIKDKSSRVVMCAIGINLANTALKFYLSWWCGSPSLYSEAVHSVVDTVNQVFLLYGLYWSKKKADSEHPYGFGIAKNVTALISGICFFGAGAGSAFHRAFTDYMNPAVPGDLFWPIIGMSLSLISEGASFVYAYRVMKENATQKGKSLWQFIKHGHDPNVAVVLCEDGAAVLGVFVAMVAMAGTHITQNPMIDTGGALIIASLMAGISGLLIQTNVSSLIQRSIPEEDKRELMKFLEDQPIIRLLQDIKATEVGGEVRFKAELSFDGGVLYRLLMEKKENRDLRDKIIEELANPNIKNMKNIDALMEKLCSSLLDLIGKSIDDLEEDIKKHSKLPIRHIDLEPI